MTSAPRVGFGFDAHRLAERRADDPPVLLGGVEASRKWTVVATSDGDVLAHATCDALLGAAGLGDVGEFFPPDDSRWLDADSLRLLTIVLEQVFRAGYEVSSVDSTVIAQSVRVAPIRDAIRSSLAAVLGIVESAVSVKATTTDGLGYLGNDEGIAATAVAVLTSR